MSILPIVRRELQVAARKRSTFWLRVAAAITAVVLASGWLFIARSQGVSSAEMGSILFYVLAWTCMAAALSAGLFFTSDCLSEEKREGTLGFLFLTDLRGYDVVSGKLLATSVRGFYALLAFLPILAITQMMGGITGVQYWKSSLSLVNGLFCSLAVGMFVSAISRDSQKALAATLLALLLLALGGPLADSTIALLRKRSAQPFWSLSSPAYVLVTASAWGRSPYWTALLITQLFGWTMFALACAVVPHTWQERKSRDTGSSRGWPYAWKYGGLRRRVHLRRTLLERQPLAWLVCRERWQSVVMWIMALVTAAGFLAVLCSALPVGVWITWNYVGGLFTLVLYLWAASQACRFLIEARRSGLIELLLATPITEKQIIHGHWQGLRKMFGLPVLLLLSAVVAGAVLSQRSFQSIASQAGRFATSVSTNQSGATTNQGVVAYNNVTIHSTGVISSSNAGTNTALTPTAPSLGSAGQLWIPTIVAAAAAALGTAGNLLALGWFGMWMGLTTRTANLATLKTILFVQVIPWFVIAFGSMMLMGLVMTGFFRGSSSIQPTRWLVWWPLVSAVVSTILALIKDITFITWSRKRLYSSFREQAACDVGQQPRFLAAHRLPVAMPIPPVIPTQP